MKNRSGGNLPYHITAAVTSAVWGTTFISSKLLLAEGLSPAAIMTLRSKAPFLKILRISL